MISGVLFVAGCSGGGSAPAEVKTVSAPVVWYVPDGASVTGAPLVSLFDSNQLYIEVQGSTNSIRGKIVPFSTTFKTDAGDPFAPNPANNPVTFATILRGDQVRPRNVLTAASGYGSVTLNPLTRQITGFIITSGISGNAANIHDGISGTSGATVVTMEGGPLVWTVPAGTVLTGAQMARLSSGAFYFDVLSETFPDGEIRGQLNQQVRFASLKGSNQVPPVTTSTTGVGFLALNTSNRAFSGFVKVAGLGSAITSASLNTGASGTNGSSIVSLTNNGNGIWSVPPKTVLGTSNVANFNNDELYFNIRTEANPVGELRGQILKSDVRIGTANLNGSQAACSGIISLNSVTELVSGSVTCDNVYGNGTTVKIHSGSATTAGPPVVDLTESSPVSVAPAPGISFKLDIQPVFNASCAVSYCHVKGGLAPMSLEEGASYANMFVMVEPGKSAESYLIYRLTKNDPPLFSRMPLNRGPLNPTSLDLLKAWIDSGAPDN